MEGGVEVFGCEIVAVEGVHVHKSEMETAHDNVSGIRDTLLVQHLELITLDQMFRPWRQSQGNKELVIFQLRLNQVIFLTKQHILKGVLLLLRL